MMTSYGFWEGGGEREMTAPLRAAMTRPAAEWTASRRTAAEVLATEKEASQRTTTQRPVPPWTAARSAGEAVTAAGRSTASPLNYYFFILRGN